MPRLNSKHSRAAIIGFRGYPFPSSIRFVITNVAMPFRCLSPADFFPNINILLVPVRSQAILISSTCRTASCWVSAVALCTGKNLRRACGRCRWKRDSSDACATSFWTAWRSIWSARPWNKTTVRIWYRDRVREILRLPDKVL